MLVQQETFAGIYAGFSSSIANFDCGDKCAPYNEGNIPFCCDTRHAVPTAYLDEWQHLQANTDLWHFWQGEDSSQSELLQRQTPPNQVLLECQGYKLCQRQFRALTCRAFPFFPYIARNGDFLGLSYYWEYQDRCWVISNLQVVTAAYRQEFIAAFEKVFALYPQEHEAFSQHSAWMNQIFMRKRRTIPLLHHNDYAYKISPHSGKLRRVPIENLPKFGPYKIAANLPFPEESL